MSDEIARRELARLIDLRSYEAGATDAERAELTAAVWELEAPAGLDYCARWWRRVDDVAIRADLRRWRARRPRP